MSPRGAPTPEAISPTRLNVSVTSSAPTPNAKRDLDACCISGNSKGVSAPNFCKSFINKFAFSALPSIVVKATWLCSIAPAILIAFAPNATTPTLTAVNPVNNFFDPSAAFSILFLILFVALLSPFSRFDKSASIRTTKEPMSSLAINITT